MEPKDPEFAGVLRRIRDADEQAEYHTRQALEWRERARRWREEVRRQIVQAARNG